MGLSKNQVASLAGCLLVGGTSAACTVETTADAPPDGASDEAVTISLGSPDESTSSPDELVKGTASFAECSVAAIKPVTLTPKSRNIFAEGRIVQCVGAPDACHIGVDLEQWTGKGDTWRTVAHNPGEWKACSGNIEAVYKNCTHDDSTQYWYRSHVWAQLEKDGAFSEPKFIPSKHEHYHCF